MGSRTSSQAVTSFRHPSQIIKDKCLLELNGDIVNVWRSNGCFRNFCSRTGVGKASEAIQEYRGSPREVVFNASHQGGPRDKGVYELISLGLSANEPKNTNGLVLGLLMCQLCLINCPVLMHSIDSRVTCTLVFKASRWSLLLALIFFDVVDKSSSSPPRADVRADHMTSASVFLKSEDRFNFHRALQHSWL